jgi:formate/nitrite transporter FocA (FNT family)
MMAASFHGIPSAASLGGFLLGNLVPVTIGNLIGGAGFVAAGLFLLFGEHESA